MPKTPKELVCALIRCENGSCINNRDGECHYGMCFRIMECGEYITQEQLDLIEPWKSIKEAENK